MADSDLVFNFSKKNSSLEEQKLKKLNIIIAENEQKSNELSCFFSRKVLEIADKKKLIELERLAQEVPFKWCRDAVNAEWKRRAV